MNTAIMAASVTFADFWEIQKQYLQMAPLKGFIWKEIEQTNHGLETQRRILDMTYFFAANLKYAPSVSYQRLFLRHLLKLCEDNGSEISDELYEAYGEVIGKVEQADDKCYKTYMLPCGAMITLEETQQFISQGTTGLSTWMAGEYLAEWAMENMSNFQKRNIIELGCGTGLTGLVICTMCSPCRYIFTDCHESVLEALQYNLGINGFALSCEASETKEILSWMSKGASAAKTNVDKNMQESSQRTSAIPSLHKANEKDDNVNDNQRAFVESSELPNSLCSQGTGFDLQTTDTVVNPSCIACLSDCSGSDGFNPSSNATDFIAHFSRKSDQGCRHLSEDCEHFSGNVQVGVCKLDWNSLRRSDLDTFPVGIILAADVIYDVDLIPSLVRTLHLLLSACGDEGGRPVAYISSTIRNPQTYAFFINQLSEHGITWSEEIKPKNQLFYYDRSCEIKIIRLQI